MDQQQKDLQREREQQLSEMATMLGYQEQERIRWMRMHQVQQASRVARLAAEVARGVKEQESLLEQAPVSLAPVVMVADLLEGQLDPAKPAPRPTQEPEFEM